MLNNAQRIGDALLAEIFNLIGAKPNNRVDARNPMKVIRGRTKPLRHKPNGNHRFMKEGAILEGSTNHVIGSKTAEVPEKSAEYSPSSIFDPHGVSYI